MELYSFSSETRSSTSLTSSVESACSSSLAIFLAIRHEDILHYLNRRSGSAEVSAMRAFLVVVPYKANSIKSFFFSHSFLTKNEDSSGTLRDLSDKRIARKFANKLHECSHLTVQDIVTICTRARVTSLVLQQALKSFVERCKPCQSTNRNRLSSGGGQPGLYTCVDTAALCAATVMSMLGCPRVPGTHTCRIVWANMHKSATVRQGGGTA